MDKQGISVPIFTRNMIKSSNLLQDDARELISKNMKDGMVNYNKSGSEGVKETWDIMQSDFKCCGVDTYKEWFNVSGFENGKINI